MSASRGRLRKESEVTCAFRKPRRPAVTNHNAQVFQERPARFALPRWQFYREGTKKKARENRLKISPEHPFSNAISLAWPKPRRRACRRSLIKERMIAPRGLLRRCMPAVVSGLLFSRWGAFRTDETANIEVSAFLLDAAVRMSFIVRGKLWNSQFKMQPYVRLFLRTRPPPTHTLPCTC